MQKTVISILCWLILTGSGCGNKSARVHTGSPGVELRVIVHLETRNEVVSIMSGHEGLIYTVTTKDGRILGQNLYEQELQVKLPNIYHFLITSYADDERSGAADCYKEKGVDFCFQCDVFPFNNFFLSSLETEVD